MRRHCGRNQLDRRMRAGLPPANLLNVNGTFSERMLRDCNVAFRCGVPHRDKPRGCDGLKDSLANTACQIPTPITLCVWGHIAEAFFRIRPTPGRWDVGTLVHRPAYKFLPIRGIDSLYAAISLRNPETEYLFRFYPIAQLLRPISTVLRYNCFSLLLKRF